MLLIRVDDVELDYIRDVSLVAGVPYGEEAGHDR